MANPVWLDTDIGSDVDDAVALCLALMSPEIDLIGVSTVYGDVQLRGRIACKLLDLAGRGEVPVHAGCGRTVLNDRPIRWAGWEGEGLLEPGDDQPLVGEHAIDAMARAVGERPGEVDIVAVGPLTNLAVALMRDPDLARKARRFVIMGGLCRCGQSALEERFAEYNIACDPEAADIVFHSGAEIVMVGLDVTLRVVIRADDVERLAAVADPLRLALADQLRRYLGHVGRDYTYMHDPLAMSYVARPDLLELGRCEVLIETKSDIAAGATWVRRDASSRTQVALGARYDEFERFLVDRLTAVS